MYLIILALYIASFFTLKPLFEKAGVENAGSVARTPIKNLVVWAELIGRPKWWPILLLVPILNLFIWVGMCVHMVRSFGKLNLSDTTLATLLPPLIFNQIAKDPKATYVGPIYQLQKEYQQQIAEARASKQKAKADKLVRNNPYQKSFAREWTESIIFAVFAASFIRMFLVEAFIIPTSSMEGSLLVGDFLFVSKNSYGLRLPQTIAMLPLVHNRAPLVGGESYLEKPALPYRRLPKFRSIERYDPVVFNYPEGDSVILTPGRTYSVYDFARQNVPVPATAEVISRPMDKKDFYIKRCIGLPGEKLEVKGGKVYIDDQAIDDPTHVQHTYRVTSSSGPVSQKKLDELGVSVNDIPNNGGEYFNLTPDIAEQIKSWGSDIQVEYVQPRNSLLFPHDTQKPLQNMDNFGPVHIPAKGQKVTLTQDNIHMYRRVIQNYEKNDLQIQGDQFIINGQPTDEYTFQMDYYWMMGDNRHNSEDSRVWGFVPEDHVVGSPLFIWMSFKNGRLGDGIRWNRIFSSARKK